MRLGELNGVDETVINDQIKNYFFREGYIRKKDDEFKDVLDTFKKEYPKLMDDNRLNIAIESYKSGADHEYLNIK
jgi:hypothetical protein